MLGHFGARDAVTGVIELPKELTNGHVSADEAASVSSPGHRPMTQLGNSERLVDRYGERLLYCDVWGHWLYWDGRRWKSDDVLQVAAWAKDVVRGVLLEAVQAETVAEMSALRDWSKRCETKVHVDAMMTLARSALPVVPIQFDANVWLLNCRNGTVDLRTGEFREHRQSDYITKLVDLDYDPESSCPLWESVIERVLPDPSVRDFMQRAAGYSATGSARERKLIVPHGPGRNGKGITLETLFQVLGEYADRAPAEIFMTKRDDSNTSALFKLRGVRFMFASETNEGHRLAEATVKDMTGGESITARPLYGNWSTFSPTFTPWLVTNHRPVIRGTDNAIWDRIALVPFSVRIPDEEQDHQLADKLRVEYPGILSWIIRGSVAWYRDGLQIPNAVVAATSSYQAEMDVLGLFLEERCVDDADSRTGWVGAGSLYDAYEKWCEECGEKPLPKRSLGLRLAERGYRPGRVGATQIRSWIGLRIRGESDDLEL